ACGQARTLFRISSGAKSEGVSQVPASRPITLSPARASGSAATPPTAPRPTMTTSVPGRLIAMTRAASIQARPSRLLRGEHRVVVRGPVRGRDARVQARLVWRDRETHAGIADQVP